MARAMGCLDWPDFDQVLTLEPENMAASPAQPPTWTESGDFSKENQGDVTRRRAWMLGRHIKQTFTTMF